MIGSVDQTPRDYLCNLGPDGRRRDVDERPELCRGTVEFVATKEYMVCHCYLSATSISFYNFILVHFITGNDGYF